MKINKAQKFTIILTLMFILLCEIAVLGINYYYRDYTAYYNNARYINIMLNNYGKDGLMKALRDKALAGRFKIEEQLREMEKLNSDELKNIYSKDETDLYNKYIKPKNDKIIILHLLALTFLVLGGAIFFILREL